MSRRKTWQEKLDGPGDLPRVERIPKKLRARWGGETLVIPAPREVDALMRKVPRGRVTTINAIRAALAKKHRASIACPITTGIFAMIAAHAAEEEAANGKSRVTPWWRTLKGKGELNPKYPGGIAAQMERLEAEGHQVLRKGERAVVLDVEKRLARI